MMWHKIVQIVMVGISLMVMAVPPAQAFSVAARVDRNQISINDALDLKVVFDGGEGEVDTAVITDFKILSRSSGSSIRVINGSYSKTVTAIFQLMPRHEGSLEIPSLCVTYEGKTYHTKPIMVTVMAADALPQHSRDIFVRAELSHDRLFAGQQGIYRFQLFSAVPFSNARLKKPAFENFTVEEMGEPRKFTRVVNGREYHVVEIAYLIIPRTPGSFTIDRAWLSCDVVVQEERRSRDPFGDSFFGNSFFSNGFLSTTRPRQFSTEPLSLEVMPLPPHDGSGPASGLVGKFEMTASLDTARVRAGDSATLTVTVSGTGNVMDAKLPDLALPASVKVYADAPVTDVQLTAKGYQGTKTFKQALVPVKAGNITVPALGLSFFDVDRKAWETVFTPSVSLAVAPGEPGSGPAAEEKQVQAAAGGNRGVVPLEVDFTGRDILALKTGPGLLRTRFTLPVSWFLSLYLLPFVLLFLVQGLRQRMKKGIHPRTILFKKAAQCLKNSEKADGDDAAFLKDLYMALVYRILWAVKEKERSLTTVGACELLEKNNVAPDTLDAVRDIMQEIESARYGRAQLDKAQRRNLQEGVKRVVKLIGLVLICFTVGFSSPARAAAPAVEHPETTLLKAMSDYNAGKFAAAADKFTHLAAQGIENGGLYYNTGNAYLKAGDTGRAILWYERARKLMPHDPDLRFNLAHARTFVQDKSEAPALDITAMIFFWKDYLPPWVMTWAAIALSACFVLYAGMRRGRGKRVFTLAGTFFLVVVILAGTTVCYDYYAPCRGRSAVILSPETAIRSGLSPQATTLFLLHAGTRVRVLEKRDNYLKIIFTRDKMGWVPEKEAGII